MKTPSVNPQAKVWEREDEKREIQLSLLKEKKTFEGERVVDERNPRDVQKKKKRRKWYVLLKNLQ